MPVFYHHRPQDDQNNVIALRIFMLPEGQACVVSWPLPEPGLRVFSPTVGQPETIAQALPYAVFVNAHLQASRITVELDNALEWQPAWGELRIWADA